MNHLNQNRNPKKRSDGRQDSSAPNPDTKRQLPKGWPEKLSDLKVKLGPNDIMRRGL